MMEEKISVIISAYNTEKYIDRCLESLLKQTYKNLEIMIVDDCSTDKTLTILKRYATKDNRISILTNKENKGLSYSRNKAMEKVTGKYLAFMDSDDYIPNNFYEQLYKTIKKEKAQVAVCDINVVYEEKEEQNQLVSACVGKVTALNIINGGLAAASWNKLFERKYFCYPFEVGKINEDIASIIPLIMTVKKVAYTNETFYNYIQRENSIQNAKFNEKRFDIIDGTNLALDRLKNHKDYNKIKECLVFNQLLAVLLYAIPKDSNCLRRSKYIKRMVKHLKEYDIFHNEYYQDFIKKCNKKNRLFYQGYLFLAFHHLPLLASTLISVYNLYKKRPMKNVICKNITLELLEKEALRQDSLKENEVKITAVIPNYNYADFLMERVYSILYQTEKIDRIIILDDVSSDNSKEVITNIKNKIEQYIPIDVYYNKENSGSPFKQWAKGIKLATSEYVWICEADDFCENTFLEEIMKPLKNDKEIVLSYCNTAFINSKGNVILKDVTVQIDLMNKGHWKHSYVNNGKDEVKEYSYLNCTIPNVSGVIIKKGNYEEIFEKISHYRQAGDWLFYVSLMKEGKVAYTNKVLNYYRVHGSNVSSTFKKQAHLEEIKKIHKEIKENFILEENAENQMEKRYQELKEVWNLEE